VKRIAGALAAVALATLPLWLTSPYHVHVAIMAGIFTILALSLNLLLSSRSATPASSVSAPTPRRCSP
jgi:ABC-type branched-subunit amino acid transport system permease subunit